MTVCAQMHVVNTGGSRLTAKHNAEKSTPGKVRITSVCVQVMPRARQRAATSGGEMPVAKRTLQVGKQHLATSWIDTADQEGLRVNDHCTMIYIAGRATHKKRYRAVSEQEAGLCNDAPQACCQVTLVFQSGVPHTSFTCKAYTAGVQNDTDWHFALPY
jgi:hypothetical protein